MNFTAAVLPMPETRASIGFARIGGKRKQLLSGNNAHIKNHAVLKLTYHVAFKELARNHARNFIVS
jgi:hypothetical protein